MLLTCRGLSMLLVLPSNPLPDSPLSYSPRDATGGFTSFEWVWRACFGKLVRNFISLDSLMSRRPHQMAFVGFILYHRASVAIPDQFRVNFTVVKCFNCSLTLWENTNVSVATACFSVLTCTCLNCKYLGLKHRWYCPSSSALITFGSFLVSVEPLYPQCAIPLPHLPLSRNLTINGLLNTYLGVVLPVSICKMDSFIMSSDLLLSV
jgi:hypothetical protein